MELGTTILKNVTLYILIYFGSDWITFLLESDENELASHFVEKRKLLNYLIKRLKFGFMWNTKAKFYCNTHLESKIVFVSGYQPE